MRACSINPEAAALLGIPGVQTIRSTSMFGMSFIYIIFKDNVEFYWSRSRILEKLNSLPSGTLPQGVQPTLGPDATALGQIYWYTLEGSDTKTGEPSGGWDPQELRTIQDFYVKYGLTTAEGVSEVASVGGFIKEYQIDLNPEALKAFGVSTMDVMNAVICACRRLASITHLRKQQRPGVGRGRWECGDRVHRRLEVSRQGECVGRDGHADRAGGGLGLP